jgi:hypothetical protein
MQGYPASPKLTDATRSTLFNIALLTDEMCLISLGANLVLGANLALNKPAFQSSTLTFNSHVAIASEAVDGNTDSNYERGKSCSHTSFDKKAWWAVDLGAASSISSVTITNRGDCCRKLLSIGISSRHAVIAGILKKQQTTTFKCTQILGKT